MKSIPEQLAVALATVSSKAWRSTSQLYAALPDKRYVGRTALSNRLQRLRALGYVTCMRRGKDKFWMKA